MIISNTNSRKSKNKKKKKKTLNVDYPVCCCCCTFYKVYPFLFEERTLVGSNPANIQFMI